MEPVLGEVAPLADALRYPVSTTGLRGLRAVRATRRDMSPGSHLQVRMRATCWCCHPWHWRQRSCLQLPARLDTPHAYLALHVHMVDSGCHLTGHGQEGEQGEESEGDRHRHGYPHPPRQEGSVSLPERIDAPGPPTPSKTAQNICKHGWQAPASVGTASPLVKNWPLPIPEPNTEIQSCGGDSYVLFGLRRPTSSALVQLWNDTHARRSREAVP